jgi:hypothetical protein
MAPKAKVDYESMKHDWMAGVKSPQQMAVEYTEWTGIKVTRQAIIKHFKRAGLERSMAAAIQLKADAMVAASMVAGMVAAPKTQNEITNIVGRKVADVRLTHRADIARARTHLLTLQAQAEYVTNDIDLFKKLNELVNDDTVAGAAKRMEVYKRALSLSSRIENAKKLTETLRLLISLERESYGIDLLPPDENQHSTVTIRHIRVPARELDEDGQP